MKKALLVVACLIAVALADDEADFKKHARRAAPRDAFPVLNHPKMVDVVEGSKSVEDDEPVLGISLGGEQKAYPISIMGRHELANDTCGKIPLAASW